MTSDQQAHDYRDYTEAEVALIYLMADRPAENALLASVLDRSAGAINVARRWLMDASPSPATNDELRKLAVWASRTLGPANRGSVYVS